ncbi:hypothetical protein [Streptomyces sp. NPDC048641]|uniref:hypothetical protein n=1 Tax=unclassified Streptomyces TaxID=2593676 RepID=UPI003418B36C
MDQGYGSEAAPGGFGPPPPTYLPAPAAGPKSLAADAGNDLVVDSAGVHFEQGPHTVELPWPRIRTVQLWPMGMYLSVVAVMLDGRVFECRGKARRVSRLLEWCAELNTVLHHYLSPRESS